MRAAFLTLLLAACPSQAAEPEPEAPMKELDARVAEPVDEPVEAGGPREAAPAEAAAAPEEVGPLVIHELWSMVDAEHDPFDRPQDAGCNRAGVMPELLADEAVYSVDTGFCGYITATQTTLLPIAKGQRIKARLWHFELSAPQPAMAHAEVTVDGLAVLDEQVPIPSPGGLLVRELVAPRAIPKGAPAFFHLHNHGANSWSLVAVAVLPRTSQTTDSVR
ncbi:MAG: hypothetical protein ABW352_06140 [Polyangiales bacterium]